MLRSLVVTGWQSTQRPGAVTNVQETTTTTNETPAVTERWTADACLSSDDALEPLYASMTQEHGYARCPTARHRSTS